MAGSGPSDKVHEYFAGNISKLPKYFNIFSHEKRHPLPMGEHEVSKHLSHLAVEGKVSASTQNQALSVLLFLRRFNRSRLNRNI
ncbi:MAG: hypothetical protein CV087_01920 [Candidatus Brocadia sp. WS118]|nr:MAG: hypothetical protein CV087_01920 [Candidatus Brocadia sp. WS118]